MNSFGEITEETLGNGVVTNRSFDAVTSWLSSATAGVGGGSALLNQSYAEDKDGDIIERQNNNFGLTENLFYDADNRITCATLTSSCSTPTFVYERWLCGSREYHDAGRGWHVFVPCCGSTAAARS